jgi:soluble cytochrome b562
MEALEDLLGITELETEVKEEKEKVEKIKKTTSTVEADDARKALGEFLGVEMMEVKSIHEEFDKLSNQLDDAEREIKRLKSILKAHKIDIEDGEKENVDEEFSLVDLEESDEGTVAKEEPKEGFGDLLGDL